MGKNKYAKEDFEGATLVPAVSTPVAVEPVSVKLRNNTRSHLVFNLPHATYCANGPCACQKVESLIQEYDYRNSEHVAKIVDRLICASASWLALETLEVDVRMLRVTDIANAIARSELTKV